MWIERTTYTTAYTFPGILKWFEVKHISIVSHLKVELGIFLSPNKIRAFVKSPLWFSLAPPASFIFQKRNKRHACRIELLCKTDVTTPVLKVTASEWLFYKTKWVLSPQGSCQHPETFLKFLLRVCYHLTFFPPRILPLLLFFNSSHPPLSSTFPSSIQSLSRVRLFATP